MSSVCAVLIGAGLIAFSGIPAALGPSRSRKGQWCTVLLFVAGSVFGVAGTGMSLLQGSADFLIAPWFLPWGRFSVSIDRLSAFFLLLVFTVPALGSFYSLGYWKQDEHPENGRRLGIFFGLLTASMAMVVIARDSVLFLLVWEIMALSAWFAASVEGEKSEVRKAGWIYLVATHMGTLTLLAMFALWHKATGTFSLELAASVPAGTAGIIFALSVIGFGFKAGLMPLHVWLPGAHANAPSHVSAVMSGVMLKMGIYGIVRMASLFASCKPWWGAALLAVGCVSALFGIAFAMGQRDIKRILAYSSIENIGIVAMGIGLALLGKSFGSPALVLLGLGGALFHVWNHGLFKSLLFLGSGAIIHATETRDIESLGGLAKKMPLTAALFTVGAVAISALPPLNGFAGEWLIYMGMFKTLSVPAVEGLSFAAIAAVVLSMVGALAVAVFVRLVCTVFLGSPRSDAVSHAHDARFPMAAPMIVIAFACLFLGVFPTLVAPALEGAARAWAPLMDIPFTIPHLVPQGWIAWMNAGLLTLLMLGCLWYFASVRKRVEKAARPTWDCGYAKPTARVQYSGSSLAQMCVDLFSFALRPSRGTVKLRKPFAEPARFEETVSDTVLDRLVLPVFARINAAVPKFYILQQGQTHLYVLYVVIIAAVLFVLGLSGVIK